MTGYADLANNLTSNKGNISCSIPEGWRQGRTAYGGLTAALSYEAAMVAFDDLPPLRSANINFIGPVSGDPHFSSKLLRRGKNVTSLQVDAAVDGACVATSTFIFGADRDSILSVPFPAPKTLPPEKCKDFTPPQVHKFVPAFFLKFETKLIAGGRPMSGMDEGYIRAWSRHADPASREGMGSLLCLGDVLPPAAIPMFKRMGPVSSVNWMINFISPPITKEGWWHVETRQTAASGGYSSQVMRYWNTEGTLVAEGMQAVAIFI